MQSSKQQTCRHATSLARNQQRRTVCVECGVDMHSSTGETTFFSACRNDDVFHERLPRFVLNDEVHEEESLHQDWPSNKRVFSACGDPLSEEDGHVSECGSCRGRNLNAPLLRESREEHDSTTSDADRVRLASRQEPLLETHPSRWPERVRVVVLCFLSFVICNCDRINISVAIIPMAKHYGWSKTTEGIVQSAFFWGYVLTQIPGGYLADRYGGKYVLAFGVVSWSAMTFLTPLAASSGMVVLLAARMLLGIGEGVAMPAMNNMVSKWVPEGERARSLSLIYSGMYLGSVVGLLLCPKLISSMGWQSVFYFFGSLGFFWCLAWNKFVASSPEESSTISESELEYLCAQREATFKSEESISLDGVPWRKLLSEKATWAIIVAHFCATWGYFVLLTWLPSYFNRKLGFNLTNSSFLSIVPWLAMFLSANAGGALADSLLENNFSVTAVRKFMQTIGFLGPAVFLGLVSTTRNAVLAVVYMTAALGLGSFSQSGVYSNHQDIGPAYTGILLGISNTGASIPGIVGVALTGYILDLTNSWNLVFGIAIGFYLFGTIVYNALGTGERIF